MKQIGIQKIFWESFEFAVSTQAKRLARDIADALGQDAAPLIAEIQNDKIGVYLFEDSGLEDTDLSEMRCGHTMPVSDVPALRTPCMEPVVWSTNPVARPGACLYHCVNPEPRDPAWKSFTAWEHEGERYYINTEDGSIHGPPPIKTAKPGPVIGFVDSETAFEDEPEVCRVTVKKVEIDGRPLYLDPSNDRVYDLKFIAIGRFNRAENILEAESASLVG